MPHVKVKSCILKVYNLSHKTAINLGSAPPPFSSPLQKPCVYCDVVLQKRSWGVPGMSLCMTDGGRLGDILTTHAARKLVLAPPFNLYPQYYFLCGNHMMHSSQYCQYMIGLGLSHYCVKGGKTIWNITGDSGGYSWRPTI